MKQQINAVLNSEKAMTAVNLLFFFSIFLRNRGIIFIAYAAWIAYLAYSIKRTPSKTSKVIHGILLAFAFFMIVANLYFSR